MNSFPLAHRGHLCIHAHRSVHKVCLGKFLFPSFTDDLLCTNPWCCKQEAVTAVRTFSGDFSMPAAETLQNPPGSCHACWTVLGARLQATLSVMCLNASAGIGAVCNACWTVRGQLSTVGHRSADRIQTVMNCELRFSKVLNWKVGKHLSKWAHGVWVLITYIMCGSCLSVFFYKFPSGERNVLVSAPASPECVRCKELGIEGVQTRGTEVPWASSWVLCLPCWAFCTILNPWLHLRPNWNRRQHRLYGREGRSVLVGVWMFCPMHVGLFCSNISSDVSQNFIVFHVITDLFWKILILTNAQLLLELVDLKCLYFHSPCLYWLIVATNSMVALKSSAWLMVSLWEVLIISLGSVLCTMPYIPISHLLFVLTKLFWFYSFMQH